MSGDDGSDDDNFGAQFQAEDEYVLQVLDTREVLGSDSFDQQLETLY